jgi:hypothetical protein
LEALIQSKTSIHPWVFQTPAQSCCLCPWRPSTGSNLSPSS